MNEEPTHTNPGGANQFYNAAANAQRTSDSMDHFLDAGTVDAVYGEPVFHGDTMILPAAEIISAFGVGYGGGGGSAESDKQPGGEPSFGGGGGGGGGGRIFSRPVSVIISDAGGVRVEHVLDVTKLGLAALTAFGFMAGMYFRMRSPHHMEQEARRHLKHGHG
jgi:uncharacterized spore protein YtfJ